MQTLLEMYCRAAHSRTEDARAEILLLARYSASVWLVPPETMAAALS